MLSRICKVEYSPQNLYKYFFVKTLLYHLAIINKMFYNKKAYVYYIKGGLYDYFRTNKSLMC